MTLEQALEIVKDHIRIGKDMELVNGIPGGVRNGGRGISSYAEGARVNLQNQIPVRLLHPASKGGLNG